MAMESGRLGPCGGAVRRLYCLTLVCLTLSTRTVTVTLRSWENLPVVPTAAVATDDTGNRYVVVVEDNDRLRRQVVVVVFDNGTDVGISDGIEVGTKLAVKDIAKLADGQEVARLPRQ